MDFESLLNQNKFPLLVKTISAIEPLLAEELKELGASDIKAQNRSVSCQADLETLYRINMFSRLSGRVLLPLITTDVRDKKHFYDLIYNIDWAKIFSVNKLFVVDSMIHNSRFIDNSMYSSLLAKDAIVDRFRKDTGRRPSIDRLKPDIRVHVHLNRNRLSISLDTSGDPLHKRGYRQTPGEAPLSELLAASIITLSGWDKKQPLVDPMCGSGTIAIEAALMAADMAPCLFNRTYCFKNWVKYDMSLFENLKEEAEDRVNKDIPFKIYASDIDRNQTRKAKKNVFTAMVNELVEFETIDFHEYSPPPPPGYLVTNPPYGERLSIDDLAGFYKQFGDTLKQKYQGYKAYLLVSDLEATKMIGLRSSKKIKLFNGPIETRLCGFELYSGSKKQKHQRSDNTDDTTN